MRKNKLIQYCLIGISVLGGLIGVIAAITASLEGKCYADNEEIPCKIFWNQYGWFLAIPFIFAGVLLLTGKALKFEVWYMKILGGKWEPGKLIPKLYRFTGVIFLLLGIYFFLLTLINLFG